MITFYQEVLNLGVLSIDERRRYRAPSVRLTSVSTDGAVSSVAPVRLWIRRLRGGPSDV